MGLFPPGAAILARPEQNVQSSKRPQAASLANMDLSTSTLVEIQAGKSAHRGWVVLLGPESKFTFGFRTE